MSVVFPFEKNIQQQKCHQFGKFMQIGACYLGKTKKERIFVINRGNVISRFPANGKSNVRINALFFSFFLCNEY